MSGPDLAVVAGAYLLGSVPFAWLVARASLGIDLRRAGSGNVGAANVQRTLGTRRGVLVALLDVCKGAASVWLAALAGALPPVVSAAGVAAVAGHVFPVWLGFRGGKGVAASCGVFAVLAPLPTCAAVAVFFAVVFATRYVSLGSLVAVVVLWALTFWQPRLGHVSLAAFTVAAIVVARHRQNIVRLWRGNERRIGGRRAEPPGATPRPGGES